MTDEYFQPGDLVQMIEPPLLFGIVTQVGSARGQISLAAEPLLYPEYVRVIFDNEQNRRPRSGSLVLKSRIRKLNAVELLAEIADKPK